MDMFGIDAANQAGQDYYDSIFRLYASWGVDYVKVDDLSAPYYQRRRSRPSAGPLTTPGGPMVFSTSPGATPVESAGHVADNANMWRISGDFWDNWGSLDHRLISPPPGGNGIGGPGHRPDGDMIPLGHIAIRSRTVPP